MKSNLCPHTSNHTLEDQCRIPQRWIIDFNDMSIEEAICYQLPFRYVKATVKPQRDKTQDIEAIKYWWKYWRSRPEMRKAIAPLSYYFNIPRHSKWFIFVPTQLNWLPGDSTAVVASDDFYILGILTSRIYRLWIKA